MKEYEERNLPATTQPAPLISWKIMQRSAAITGIAAVELILFSAIASTPWSGGLETVLVATCFLGMLGAGAAALFARPGRSGVALLESELKRAIQLMEQRLITEEDFRMIKARLIGETQPASDTRGRAALRGGAWGALAGLTLTQVGIVFSTEPAVGPVLLAAILLGTAGTALGGGASAALQLLRYRVENFRGLPAPAAPLDHRPRLNEPSAADRPLLKG